MAINDKSGDDSMARGPITAMPAYADATKAAIERLFDMHTRPTQTGCLQWTGPVTRVGKYTYPTFCFAGLGTTAHRWAYHLKLAPLGDGDQLLRRCPKADPLCVEPLHFELKRRAPKLIVKPDVKPAAEPASKTWPAPRPRKNTSRPSPALLQPPRPRTTHPSLTGAALSWEISNHGRGRAAELGFSINEVLLTAAYPEVSYVSGPGYPPGAMLHQRGDCAVAVLPSRRLVLTVLLRKTEQWTHGVDKR